MTPAARLAACIELLDELLRSWQSEKRFPADKFLDRYFKARRYIGAKDRGTISELFYWVLRHKASLEWHCEKAKAPPPVGGRLGGGQSRTAVPSMPPPYPSPCGGGNSGSPLREEHNIARPLLLAALLLRKEYTADALPSLFTGEGHAPAPLTPEEQSLCKALSGKSLEHPDMPPWVRLNYAEWIHEHLVDAFGDRLEEELRALSRQAPLDLRTNTLKTTRDDLLHALRKEGHEVEPTRLSPLCLRMKKRTPIFTSPLFKEGLFEVQDEASQAVALLVDAQPGQKVIDFCAGAGGKTLAIAASMENKGRILAFDNSAKRMAQLRPRQRRAGVHNVQTHLIASENDPYLKRHKATADRVLVDAPCSGSGTWRRNPDLKWRFTQADLDEVLAVQQRILASASRLVKIGGRLVYATCSLLRCENERQIEWFLAQHPNFRVVCAKEVWNKSAPGRQHEDVSFFRVTPHQDGADGFFAAVLERAV